MRFYLISVENALPAIQAHFEAFPDGEADPTRKELRDLVRLTFEFAPVSDLLVDYALALGGKPGRTRPS